MSFWGRGSSQKGQGRGWRGQEVKWAEEGGKDRQQKGQGRGWWVEVMWEDREELGKGRLQWGHLEVYLWQEREWSMKLVVEMKV